MAATSGHVYRTTDGGTTWTPTSVAPLATGLLDIAFTPDALHGWATTWMPDDGVIATTDGGATWTAQNVGSGQSLYGLACTDATHVWAVGEEGGILATTTGGARDPSRPRTKALGAVTVTRAHRCALRYEVSDRGGGTALVVILVRTAKGKLVRTFTLGPQRENAALSASLRATMAKGSYRWYVYAERRRRQRPGERRQREADRQVEAENGPGAAPGAAGRRTRGTVAIGMRQPTPKARSVTFRPGAACLRLNSLAATRRTTRSTVARS